MSDLRYLRGLTLLGLFGWLAGGIYQIGREAAVPGGLELTTPAPSVFVGRLGGNDPEIESPLRLLARNEGFSAPPAFVFRDNQPVSQHAVLLQVILQAYPHVPRTIRPGMPGPYPVERLLVAPGAQIDTTGYALTDSLNGYILYTRRKEAP